MELVIATRNAGKLREISSCFSAAGIRCLDLSQVKDAPLVREDSTTFIGNAVKKAVTIAMGANRWSLADDSGLEVDALDGAPGVYSSRYAGESADDDANNEKLLRALRDIPVREARFRCVLALSSPAGRAQIVEGECRGRIAMEKRGREGFGYDPLFIPEGYEQTLAELGPEVKNIISHRAAALREALTRWSAILSEAG